MLLLPDGDSDLPGDIVRQKRRNLLQSYYGASDKSGGSVEDDALDDISADPYDIGKWGSVY